MVRRAVFLLLLCLGCAPAPPPAPVVAPPPPPLTAAGTAQRVVLLSFDGLGADALGAQPTLNAFAELERDGASARIIPIDPTLTGPAHATLLTGAEPKIHGVVANRYHAPGTPPDRVARGLDTEPDVETIMEAARRQGKRVGAVPFPGVFANSTRKRTDFGMSWPVPLVPARMVRLARADFHREWVPPTWTRRPGKRESFSPIMRARVEWNIPAVFRADLDVVAYDTTNDAAENYDLFLVESDEREITPDARGWFPLSVETAEGVAGSWSKLLRADPSLANVTIYWGAITRTAAWPDSFRATIERDAGFWPGAPEETVDVEREVFVEQSERLAAFLTRVQTLTIRTMSFDLLLAYQPQIDTVSHNYLDAASQRAAFLSADRAVAAIREALDLSRDALVVTGDHGIAPVDVELRVNRLLADHGFAPRWRAFGSGNHTQLYRFGGSDDSDAVVNLLTGSGYFERVEKKAADAHRNSGDVIGYAKPNVLLSMANDGPLTRKPEAAGNHGALSSYQMIHTALFAVGAGTPKGPQGEVAQTRVARFVAALLGITPPAAAADVGAPASRRLARRRPAPAPAWAAGSAAAGRRRASRRDAGAP